MTDAWQLFLAVGAAVGVLALISGAAAVVVTQFRRAKNDYIRQDNEDLKNRVETLEHENRILTAQLETARANNETHLSRIERLEELVTQRAAVDKVLAEVKIHSAAAERWWQALSEHDEAVEELLVNLVGSVNKLADRLP
jgi:uncharacterized protein HemX